MHPVMLGIWKSLKKPKFSGLPKDVAEFVRNWTEVEKVIHSSSPFPVTDFAMLMELRGCLDEASAEILKARMLAESNLQYQEYWDAFRHEWGYDAQKQNRAEWVAVKLVHSGPKGAEVTLGDWRTFQARFTAARARVADRTKRRNTSWCYVSSRQRCRKCFCASSPSAVLPDRGSAL